MSAPKHKCPNCGEYVYGTHDTSDCLDAYALRVAEAVREACALNLSRDYVYAAKHQDVIYGACESIRALDLRAIRKGVER